MGNCSMRRHLLAVLYCLCSWHTVCCNAKMNVLFLVADDMRPEIGAYQGDDFPSKVHPKMYTPNLDALASQGLLLKRAYCQEALCSPSRTSLLTGRRPDTTHVYDLVHYFRKVGGNFTTIPQYFKENGYTSTGMGKIFHPGLLASDFDDPISWSVPYFHAPNERYWDGEQHNSWIAVSNETRQKFPLPDEQIADRAIDVLKTYSSRSALDLQPFFLAVGFHKPHLPFVFPEEFLDHYPRDGIQLPSNLLAPIGMPSIAWWSYGGLRAFKDIAIFNASGDINTTLPYDKMVDLRRAYYSALSHTDYQIGQVLAQLNDSGLAENTVVSFWGDHGWQLGEHGEWCKQTNFELTTHAPLIIKVPGLTDGGIVSEELVEFVDVFPTLAEVTGLPPLPLCPDNSTLVDVCTEGISMVPLMKQVNVTWKDRVFSQYPREGNTVMGYTMRTQRYRYTEWAKFNGYPEYKPNWATLYGRELYDHFHDPGENWNVVDDTAYGNVTIQLSKLLHSGWRSAYPHRDY